MSGNHLKLQTLVTYVQSGRFRQAIELADEILRLDPRNFDALHLRALACFYDKKLPDALLGIERALTIRKDIANAFNTYGIILKALGRYGDAIVQFKAALHRKPDYKEALYNIANCYQEKEDFDSAVRFYEKAIALDANLVAAINNLGVVLARQKKHAAALKCFDDALRKVPRFAEAHYNRGDALAALGDCEAAISAYDVALKLRPVFPRAHCNRANALRELGRLREALDDCDKAIAQDVMFAEAYVSKAVVLNELGQLEESIACLDKAISLKPDYAEAHSNRGNALKDLRRFDEALASYNKAISLKPDYAEAYYNLGKALKDLKRLDEALASYNKAISLKPDYAEAYGSRGNALSDLRRFDEALASYDKAISLNPAADYLLGTRLHTTMKICDWTDLEAQLHGLEQSVRDGRNATAPWAILGLLDRPELHLAAAKIHTEARYPSGRRPAVTLGGRRDGKIRIGYYSADFHNHATSFLMAELLEEHDRSRFEFHGFSFGPRKLDDMRDRVSAGFDQFHEVNDLSDRQIVNLSHKLGIDIAVDLKGYTKDCRTGIFAERAAPVQVSYLGHPGTMGASFIDYIIADGVLIPECDRQFYSEKVICLPGSYQANDSKRVISDRAFTRAELGLPDEGFVFCCFNNTYKIAPRTFDSWMRILGAVDQSVLWLFEDNESASRNLRTEAASRGINPERLVFAKRMPLDEHLARHKLADLFLDTLPCNAHTTASDALWAGLPVLTCIGKSFPARVAASLLTALGMEELIVDTMDRYEEVARDLVLNPGRLAHVKTMLQKARTSSDLFRGGDCARKLERAYLQIHRRHLDGLPPDHINL